MLEFLSQALSDKAAYVAALPMWVQLWMKAMSVVFGLGVLFSYRHVEARWLLASTLGSVLAALVWGGLYGFGPLWAVFHIVFYTPFLVYLSMRRQWLSGPILFRGWLLVASTTMMISLVFDWFDLIRLLLS